MPDATRPRAARKSPAERAAEIRDAARALALDGGLVAVTLRAVAARVGVAPALVAHYEPSMDELVAQTFRAITTDELADVVELVTGAGEASARSRVRALVATALDPARDDVTAVWVDAWSLGRRNPALAAAVRAVADGWQSQVARIVRDGIADGEFGADVDADAIAWLLVGIIDGLNAQSVVHDRHDPGRAEIVLRTIDRELGARPDV
ncbi:TetR/AcrR family transcriptional regulator [Agromyces larvae]|uniref:TetR family transcriptional regulator C-terminal domain-containing protein n=1 Tax=Agromyces larvae TaxID=2929802 RepID=A0ABY4BYV1_9MICO|nr:TetR family transcriptional regulator C-terminal domain-containing protein [Agromyces larvae]UOE44423.1 TetR family transcriptional regulator C-terminal domain-containing protein [Agromyces larvae]